MTIRIVTDSACDLPPEIIQQYDIEVIPLYINVGNKSYLDGIEMNHQQFYSSLETFPHHPQTAAPGPDKFAATYRRIAKKKKDEILSIHVAGSLSAVVSSAQKGAALSEANVTVHDSGQLSLGAGLQIITAAKAAAAGASINEIVTQLKDLGRRTYIYAVLDTLKYLQRSGRVNMATLGVGSLLRIKPLMTIHESEPISEKISTRFRAIQRMTRYIEERGPLAELHYLHTQAIESAKAYQEKTKALIPANTKPRYQSITPVIGTHVGPNVLGVVCVTKE